ncbi:hypothetical protein GCM10009087_39380 [Sphingomonas oligophenolica]|uniref:Uncharacterized protein n=1 Tax=Sphingomonas oligophenolica TaxID=301154 RepID=A0ABU9Y2G4_9SPHN
MPLHSLRVAIIAAALAAVPTTAFAQTPQDSGITYDCDTAANHFSELILPAGAAPFTVAGKVRLNQVAASKEYLPLARLAISNASDQPGPSDQAWAGFEFDMVPADKKNPAASIVAYSIRETGKKPDMQPIAIASGAEIPFSVLYDGTHVTVSVDGHEKQFAFTAAKPVVSIVCSTGEFLYTNLLIRPRG